MTRYRAIAGLLIAADLTLATMVAAWGGPWWVWACLGVSIGLAAWAWDRETDG